MSLLPQVSGSEAVRALQKAGFVLKRQRGSHALFVHVQDPARRAVVLIHGSKAIKPGTLRAILKGAGLSIEEFRNLI